MSSQKGPGSGVRLAATARPRENPGASPGGRSEAGLHGWPGTISGFSFVAKLGGSSGARLVEDAAGNRYVSKRYADPSHLVEEFRAEAAYRAMGLDVPDSRMYAGKDGKPVKVARFVSGPTLKEVPDGGELAEVRGRLRRGFAADALLANWDVIGRDADNVVIDGASGGDPGGVARPVRVWRVDVGGSLRRRAMGEKKPAGSFGAEVGELGSMREASRPSGRIFGGLSDAEVASQVRAYVLPNRAKILASVPEDLSAVVEARIDYLGRWSEKASP